MGLNIDGMVDLARDIEAGRNVKRPSGEMTEQYCEYLVNAAIEYRKEDGYYSNDVSDLLRAAARLARHCGNVQSMYRAKRTVERGYNYMAACLQY